MEKEDAVTGNGPPLSLQDYSLVGGNRGNASKIMQVHIEQTAVAEVRLFAVQENIQKRRDRFLLQVPPTVRPFMLVVHLIANQTRSLARVC